MHSSHGGMQLVDEEFNALVEDLVGALDKFKVPEKEKDELLGALGPLKPQIVNPPPAEAAAHDDKLAKQGDAKVAELRQGGKTKAADLLETAVTARMRGQRNYAEQLYSSAERLAPAPARSPSSTRCSAPARPSGSPPRSRRCPRTRRPAEGRRRAAPRKTSRKPKNGSLAGTMKVDGRAPVRCSA